MNDKKLKEYLEKKYFEDDQNLKLEFWYDEKHMKKHNEYFSQEVYCGDYVLFFIQTYEILKYTKTIAHTPYCIKNELGYYNITVPKFGQLTDKDIEKAVAYVFKQLKLYLICNVSIKNKLINRYLKHSYQGNLNLLRLENEGKQCNIL